MFLLDKSKNKVEEITKKTFKDLGFKERQHLQEWIAKNPSVFGEDLLIIQKEFAGFSDTNERIDLIALDKEGQLVVIENKLDDSGKDVVWQALKYTSYCSSLSKDNIRKMFQTYLDNNNQKITAEEKLSEFFDERDYDEIILNQGFSQRILLVAANFRKEVTSTMIWLMNYKLRIQCFRVTPYKHENQVFINFEQILPLKDAEEYMISMAEKVHDQVESEELKTRHVIRREFWIRLLENFNTTKKSDLFQNINPSKYHWIGAGSGIGGIAFNFAIAKNYGRVELYIDKGEKDVNEFIFQQLFDRKEETEKKFSGDLQWEKLEGRRACRIKSEINLNVFEKENWDEMISFMTKQMIEMERTFKEQINEVRNKLMSKK
jgi:hypothetical protein